MLNQGPVPIADYEREQTKSKRLVRTNTTVLMATVFPPSDG